MTNEVILTGANGWLGQGLLHALTHGLVDYPTTGIEGLQRLRCFYRTGEQPDTQGNQTNLNVENVFGDLSSQEDVDRLFAGCSEPIVLHTAGVIHPRRVKDFYTNNVDSALNVVDAAYRIGCKRVVVISSNSPIGCNPTPDHRFDESSPYNPYQHYGKSKKEMEQRVREEAERHDLDVVIIRPPWFYGPFQPERQTLFFTMIKEGKGPLLGQGLNQRSMVYIDNLCYGILLAAMHPSAAGETYWIADHEPYEMRTILDTIEAVLEEDFQMPVAHKRLRLPSFVSDIAYIVDAAIQGAGLYHQKFHVLSEMNKNIACSIDKAKTELGYEPKIALREGMRRSIAWCIGQGYVI